METRTLSQTRSGEGWSRLPPPLRWIGLAGLVPFFAAAILVLLPSTPPDAAFRILGAMMVYGVAILSFLGGVAWGAAMARGEEGWAPYLLAAAPCLVGWLTLLFVYPLHQAFVMALAFALLWLLDRQHAAAGRLPGPYMRLRAILTLGVVVSFLAAGFLVLPA